ncbi:MAG: ABC transporter permease, partial [Verrucomicrobiaceae bacterium]
MAVRAVKAPFSLFLALRYLKPKRTFVSIITVFSILGVTLGIMVLIVVMSVMTGFGEELRRKVLGFEAHILVTTDGVLTDWRELIPILEKTPHVIATAPFVQGPVIAEFQGRRLAPKIRGIDPEREQRVTDIKSAIKAGEFDLSGDKVIVGIGLARQLGVSVGDSITVYSPGNISEILAELDKAEKNPGEEKTMQELRQMVLPADLLVSGIFETDRSIQDTEYMLVPLHIGQELYGLEDNLHGIVLRTDD